MSKDKTSTTPGLDKDALDALNFKNNILDKLARTKANKNNKPKNPPASPRVIKGLGRLGEHKKAYKKRNTRTA